MPLKELCWLIKKQWFKRLKPVALNLLSSPNSSVRFHILPSTIQMNSDKSTSGYSPCYPPTQKARGSKSPKAIHPAPAEPRALGTHHRWLRISAPCSPRTSFIPSSAIYLLLERYVYEKVLVDCRVVRNDSFSLALI